MVKTRLIMWIAVCVAGCASQPRVADSAGTATAGFPACTAPPSPTEMLWREIRAPGFTFCVPASWRSEGPAAGPALDPRTWRAPITYPSTSITWGTGVPPAHLGTRTQNVVYNGGSEYLQQSITPVLQPPHARYTKLLGGRTAEVSEWISGGPVYDTEARWHDPAVYLRSQTRSVIRDPIFLAIQRTLRFTSAPQP
jgi:hypothetical protein